MTSKTMPAATDFEAQVGSTFRITGVPALSADADTDTADAPAAALDVALLLTTVHRLDHPGPYEQFRLTFTGPAAQPLDQGTYLVAHDTLPLDELFIVPSSELGDIRTYEANFSAKRSTPQGNEP